jgi:hypothetical protein
MREKGGDRLVCVPRVPPVRRSPRPSVNNYTKEGLARPKRFELLANPKIEVGWSLGDMSRVTNSRLLYLWRT